ncbi:hypothetical protein E2320_006301 [Naja naja]|nr:hypothetical protein E2320_006301 [Naja naja]
MEARKAMAEGGSRLPLLKQCLIRRTGQQEQRGVAASSLQELKMKACHLLAIDLVSQPVALVLAEDGTIIDDNDYFLCLPQNTKFEVVAKNEKWTSAGEGTTWLDEDITNTNEVDSAGEKWQVLARQLKNDLSTIVLMSEEDLQHNARCASEAEEKSKGGTDTVDMGSSGPSSVERTRLSARVVAVLKEKPAPELSLASQDLELVCEEDLEALSQTLRWDKHKTEALKEACRQELSRRLQQFHSLNSLRNISRGKKKLPEPGERLRSKRRK